MSDRIVVPVAPGIHYDKKPVVAILFDEKDHKRNGVLTIRRGGSTHQRVEEHRVDEKDWDALLAFHDPWKETMQVSPIGSGNNATSVNPK